MQNTLGQNEGFPSELMSNLMDLNEGYRIYNVEREGLLIESRDRFPTPVFPF